jgi:O-antigen ligase
LLLGQAVLSCVIFLLSGAPRHGDFDMLMFFVAYNLACYVTFRLNLECYTSAFVRNSFLLACALLLSSVIANQVGVDLRTFGSEYSGIFLPMAGAGTRGLVFPERFAGFAQDPNYAALFFALAFLLSFGAPVVRGRHPGTRAWRIGLCVVGSSWGLLCASSKAVFIGLALAGAVALCRSGRVRIALLRAAILTSFAAELIVSRSPGWFESLPLTMTTRIQLWYETFAAWQQDPLFGSGLGSARDAVSIHLWYMQVHSTVLQCLVELGLLGLALLALSLASGMSTDRISIGIRLVMLNHALTYETLYQAYFVLILGVFAAYCWELRIDKSSIALGRSLPIVLDPHQQRALAVRLL